MWRALFLAVGVYLCILGMECLAVEKVVLKVREPAQVDSSVLIVEPPKPGPNKQIVPPDYAPWSLIGTGLVVILYSFTLPRRLKR